MRYRHLVLVVLVLAVTIPIWFSQINRGAAPAGASAQQDERSSQVPAVLPTAQQAVVAAPAASVMPEPARSPQPSRLPTVSHPITILVLGLDTRSKENDLANANTDSMLIVSMNPQNHTATMLSVPRDLYVQIPGYGQGRINTAFGDAEGFQPGTGAAFTQKLMSDLLGIPIDDTVVIRFGVVEKLIDALGGIDVTVPQAIDDPTFPDDSYGYEPLYVPSGRQHFDGHQALRYARTRHTPGADLDRVARQQQVVLAVLDRLRRPEIWPSLVAQAPLLWDQEHGLFYTDLHLNDIISLAWTARSLDSSSVRTVALGAGYVTPWTTPQGAQVLLPLWDRIHSLVHSLFRQTNAD